MVISFVTALTLMLAFIFGPPDATANAIQTRWRLVRGGPILLYTLHLFLHQDEITPLRWARTIKLASRVIRRITRLLLTMDPVTPPVFIRSYHLSVMMQPYFVLILAQ